ACEERENILLLKLSCYLHSNGIGRGRSEDTGKSGHCTVNELDAQVSLNGITYKPIVHITRFRVLARLESIDISERKNYLFRKECSHITIKPLPEIGKPELICRLFVEQFL